MDQSCALICRSIGRGTRAGTAMRQEGRSSMGDGYDAEGPPGVVLAGGLARRMGGGDKPLLALGGRPLIRHILDRLRPQVSALALNANGDPARYGALGLPILADSLPDR